MHKKTKGWLIAAVLMIIAGLFLFWGVVMTTDGGFGRPIEDRITTQTYPVIDSFHDIYVEVDTEDVSVSYFPSLDDTVEVVCRESENISYSVSVEDNTLMVRLVDQRKWYDHISWFPESRSLQIRLPKEVYGNLTVKADTSDIEIHKDLTFDSVDVSVTTGDVYCYASASRGIRIHGSTGTIRVENIETENLDIAVSTGKVTVTHVNCIGNLSLSLSTGDVTAKSVLCKNLTSTGSTGDLILEDVCISEKLTAKRSTGDVALKDITAGEIDITTDTGDVTGNLSEAMIFIASTDTGDISVPQSTTGGPCKITTDTGDIIITVP